MSSPIIILDHVTAVRPGGEVAIRDVSWTIAEGETWAIVGPVGSGKTSLVEVLLGRHRVTAGTITRVCTGWPGDAIRLVSFRERSHFFSPGRHYYQQRFNFIEPQDDLTLEQYLRAGTDKDIAEIVSRLGLSDLLPLSFIALSTGQMRRARIARALLAEPELLILDDPFLGLDVAGRREVADLLGGVVRHGTRLILICTADEIPAWVTNVLDLGVGWVEEPKATKAHHFGELVGLRRLRLLDPPYSGTGKTIVELRNVTVAYGGRPVLRDINWTVRAGESWAVVGPNGSGKTTLLSLLCGDHPQAYANDVRLFGRRRGSGESIWDVKRSVGLVSSELHLYYAEPLTAAQAAATGFHDVLAYRPPTTEQASAVKALFAALGIEAWVDRRFDRLSTGEQRLVLLVRALVKWPPLLILDEPFQGLDRPTMERARDWLDRELNAEQSLIVVTHHPEEIPRTVSRMLRLDAGRIIF